MLKKVKAAMIGLCSFIALGLVVSCDNIAQPGGNPENENPSGENPSGENPSGENPSGENPSGENPSGENPSGENPSGENLPADPLSGHTYGIKYMSQSGITISRQGTTIVIVDSTGTEEILKFLKVTLFPSAESVFPSCRRRTSGPRSSVGMIV